jgi:hypothetical protein
MVSIFPNCAALTWLSFAAVTIRTSHPSPSRPSRPRTTRANGID